MNFEQFWAMAEPYVMWVFNFLVSTGMVSAISTLIIKGWQKKHSDPQSQPKSAKILLAKK